MLDRCAVVDYQKYHKNSVKFYNNTNNPCGNDYFVLKRDRPDGGPSPSKECRKDSNVACLCGLFTLHENDSIFKCSLIKLPVN